MVASNDNDVDGALAARLYAARSALAETAPGRHRPGIAELARVLAEPGRKLTTDEQRALFADAGLRADFKCLRARLGAIELPALAAASDGDVAVRTFDGGTLRIHPSRVPGQTYVIIEMGGGSGVPGAIMFESPQGEVLKRSLTAGDARGRIVIVLDGSSDDDRAFLRLVADPNATGALLT